MDHAVTAAHAQDAGEGTEVHEDVDGHVDQNAADPCLVADREAGAYYVDLIQGDQVSRIQVEIGLRNGSYTQVTSGLEAGDELVVGAAREIIELSDGS